MQESVRQLAQLLNGTLQPIIFTKTQVIGDSPYTPDHVLDSYHRELLRLGSEMYKFVLPVSTDRSLARGKIGAQKCGQNIRSWIPFGHKLQFPKGHSRISGN